MKEMLLQELMHLAIVAKLSAALVKMLNPVETYILNLWREALLHSIAFYIGSEYSRRVHSMDVLFQRRRHEPYIAAS
jgi:hypothetical protein